LLLVVKAHSEAGNKESWCILFAADNVLIAIIFPMHMFIYKPCRITSSVFPRNRNPAFIIIKEEFATQKCKDRRM
jgi:hypothetical protein